jgi:CRISPR-associated protein Cmr3
MHQLLLQPADVLFFRDGRPMTGASIGHGAAWPLPNVLNAALHAALHRAFVEKQADGRLLAKAGRSHARAYRGQDGERLYTAKGVDDRHFTDVWTVGPFPVKNGRWFFPRPADAQEKAGVAVTLQPYLARVNGSEPSVWSNLPKPLQFPVADTQKPSKSKPDPWWSKAAFDAYLGTGKSKATSADFASDTRFADTEYTVGIGIDPPTQTTGQGEAEGQIYSAQYLRLVEDARLGLLAGDNDDQTIRALFPKPCQIIVGGQQRVCRVEPSIHPANKPLPLPLGLTAIGLLQRSLSGTYLIKWVLLTPAVWPEIAAGRNASGQALRPHPGGWLPNWVALKWNAESGKAEDDGQNGKVLLRLRPERLPGQHRRAWRDAVQDGEPIEARLVAALVPKPINITGWSLPGQFAADTGGDGAKSTHLAVAAGTVYYFEVDAVEDSDPAGHARALLNALNWHGSTPGTEIRNRRSALLGEKGFGLGVCGTWTGVARPPPHVTAQPSA